MKLERALLGSPVEPVAAPRQPARREPVVLLQGIMRSRFSLRRMARGLAAAGFDVYNTGGPSPRQPLEAQMAKFRAELEELGRTLQQRYPGETPTVHGVGPSMGGIVLRLALAQAAGIRPGRLVAAAVPFLGARVAEFVASWSAARLVLGPRSRTCRGRAPPSAGSHGPRQASQRSALSSASPASSHSCPPPGSMPTSGSRTPTVRSSPPPPVVMTCGRHPRTSSPSVPVTPSSRRSARSSSRRRTSWSMVGSSARNLLRKMGSRRELKGHPLAPSIPPVEPPDGVARSAGQL